MRGTFWPGDIVLVSPTSWQSIRPGDIVAFRSVNVNGKTVIIHRVQAKTSAELVTRGDALSITDAKPIREADLIGCARFVQRGGNTFPVWGGRAGQLWADYLRLQRRIMPVIGWPYRFFRNSGLIRYLWRPHIAQVHLTTDNGLLIKYICGGRTVACWWPEHGRFWCRKPYDLVIKRPSL